MCTWGVSWTSVNTGLLCANSLHREGGVGVSGLGGGLFDGFPCFPPPGVVIINLSGINKVGARKILPPLTSSCWQIFNSVTRPSPSHCCARDLPLHMIHVVSFQTSCCMCVHVCVCVWGNGCDCQGLACQLPTTDDHLRRYYRPSTHTYTQTNTHSRTYPGALYNGLKHRGCHSKTLRVDPCYISRWPASRKC